MQLRNSTNLGQCCHENFQFSIIPFHRYKAERPTEIGARFRRSWAGLIWACLKPSISPGAYNVANCNRSALPPTFTLQDGPAALGSLGGLQCYHPSRTALRDGDGPGAISGASAKVGRLRGSISARGRSWPGSWRLAGVADAFHKLSWGGLFCGCEEWPASHARAWDKRLSTFAPDKGLCGRCHEVREAAPKASSCRDQGRLDA